MTRWGVLADIHGNRPALEQALREFQQRGVERIAVLGDNLGRGDSAGCVALIREVADVSVLGNRDLDWQDRVDRATADYVLSLPRVALVDDLIFSHGDARLTRDLSSNDIRADFKRARAWFAAQGHHGSSGEHGQRTWLFGHTHRARVWTLAQDGVPVLHFDAACDRLPATIDLPAIASPADLTILNAGSVGLPFPGKGPASATVYDTAARTVAFFPL